MIIFLHYHPMMRLKKKKQHELESVIQKSSSSDLLNQLQNSNCCVIQTQKYKERDKMIICGRSGSDGNVYREWILPSNINLLWIVGNLKYYNVKVTEYAIQKYWNISFMRSGYGYAFCDDDDMYSANGKHTDYYMAIFCCRWYWILPQTMLRFRISYDEEIKIKHVKTGQNIWYKMAVRLIGGFDGNHDSETQLTCYKYWCLYMFYMFLLSDTQVRG